MDLDNAIELEFTQETLGNTSDKKAHPWRKCPWGTHFVREHLDHIPPSKKHPDGKETIYREYCASNPSKKEEIANSEIQYIATTYFSDLTGPPTAGALKFKDANADEYDKEIRGWTQYWNDIFQPTILLDADLVKALIATESGFKPDPKKNRIARGLMQVRNTTRKYLGDPKGELHDYLVRLSPAELLLPNSNICAGIRWLFRKKDTARGKLKREATWEEAIEDYKDLLNKIIDNEPYNHKMMEDLNDYYGLLKNKRE